jgi:HPt (histidine-containing phosphotransfer) domain-containing protein
MMSAAPTTPDELSDLRGAFNTRLREDCRRLISLRATIVHPQEGAQSTVEELHFLAHRMCGASAIFGRPALAAAAHAFIDELSARRSLEAGGGASPPLATLDVLIDLLSRMDDKAPHDNRKRTAG